jgi:phosphatidylglycerol:prolipoprotein diacylglycerol transferase
MSFHGGVLGVALALYLFSRRTQQNLWILGDLVVAATPIGLGLGRIANFINGELYGRITSAPWGVIFPGGGPWPRHPSQLYEACAEGVCLYLCLYLGRRLRPQRAAGEQVALFLFGYAVARILAELTREPHVATGYLWGHTTLGQWLCLPLIISAFLVWRHATRR